MSIRQQQSEFVSLVAQLIQYAYANGMELTFGECYRTPEQAKLNAAKGTGISNSLHPRCRWGGDFRKPDGNHYSYSPDGVRA